MDEVDVEPVDVGDEVRIGKEVRLGTTPVVVVGPIIGELAHRRELHALGVVIDGLALRPSRRRYAPLEVGEFRIARTIMERTNGAVAACFRGRRGAAEDGAGDA